MKVKRNTILLAIGLFFCIILKGVTQNQDRSYEGNYGLEKSFKEMMENAKLVNWRDNETCKAQDLMTKVDASLLNIDGIGTSYLLSRLYTMISSNFYGMEDKIDAGVYESLADKALNSYQNSKNFTEFLNKFTGKNIGDINWKYGTFNKNGIDGIREGYKDLKSFFNGEASRVPHVTKEKFGTCEISTFSSLRALKVDYPNVVWEIKMTASVSCECSDNDDATKVKSGSFEYVATVSGSIAGSSIYKTTFGSPENPEIHILSLECCPVKKEENKTALNDSNNDGKGYFQVGVNIGLPLGMEADYYSLTYGAEVAYQFNMSGNFRAGLGVGYTHFAGKDNIKGTGFIPIIGIAQYDLSENINLRANFGYALSVDSGGSGGLNYGLGLGWEVAPRIVIQPQISFINLGDSGHFNSFGIGFLYAFWRK